MNRLLKLLGIGTVLTGYGITTVFGGKEGDGKNNKNPEEQTPSNQITSPFSQVNAFPQTQYPPVNLSQQAKQPDPFQPSTYPFQPQQSAFQPQYQQPNAYQQPQYQPVSSFPQPTQHNLYPQTTQPTYPFQPQQPAFQPQYPQANIPSQTQYQQPNIPSQPQFPQVNAFPQTTPPPSSSLAPAEKGQSVASQSDAAERLKAAVEKYIVANEKLAAAEQAYQAAGKGCSTVGSKDSHKKLRELINADHDLSMAKSHMVCEFGSFIQDTGTLGEICKIYDALSQRASKLGFNTLGKAVRKWKE